MLSALVVILTVACVVSLSHAVILTSGLLILFVVILHNLFGLFLGYTGGRLFHLKEAQVRAMAIEVGMQNSGLASTLAIMYFTAAGGIEMCIRDRSKNSALMMQPFLHIFAIRPICKSQLK